ncbi:MAG: hypothetical protein H0U18_17360 [Pyrinomonadaceae bacterium]|nr:hypothetical protein [Pyrinomonadaceae bacterium]
MSADRVAFHFSGNPSRFQLRELNGFDEQSVCGLDTMAAIGLLERLLVRRPGSPTEQFKAIQLTASERDCLLADVYQRTFGPRIESTARCALCGELFDLTFDIGNLLTAYRAVQLSETEARTEPDGTFSLPGGLRFRLPTGEDEMAVVGLPSDQAEMALLHSCIIEAEKGVNLDAVQHAMEEVAPVLDLDLDAQCPDCGSKQQVHFDIQFYLLRALEQQSKRFAREVHRLAVAYGWSLNEILSLSRTKRRTFVEFVDGDLSGRVRAST